VISSNIPLLIQCDVFVCEQTHSGYVSLQIYITAVVRCFCGACERTTLLFAVILILHRTVNATFFWLHVYVYQRFCCLSEYNWM